MFLYTTVLIISMVNIFGDLILGTMGARNRFRSISSLFAVLLVGACSDTATSADDAGSSGGGGDAGLVPPTARKRVFYFGNGTLGKIRDSADARPAVDVADEDCTDGAGRLGLGGAWKAWLSSSQADAIDRISEVGPWYRLDQETLLFASRADLVRGPRVRIDPSDMSEDWDACLRSGSCSLTFWTGTAVDGRRTSENCLDWTVYNMPAQATVGRADVAGEGWVASDPLACSAYLALLCIEQ